MQNADLARFFSSLSDDELVSRTASGELTEAAQPLAEAELIARDLPLPPPTTPADALADEEYLGDMVVLAQGLNPTDAHILCSLLQSEGITAEAGDTNLVQAHSLLAIAVGGARIRVPASQLADATELLTAYQRGDFALGDDFDANHTAP